jgi:hypothetical protein
MDRLLFPVLPTMPDQRSRFIARQPAGGVKNACEFNDFPGSQSPGDKRYSAVLTLTDDYTIRFTGPFYVNRIAAK